MSRSAASVAATAWGAVVLATDLLPPSVRYGYVHRLTRALLRPVPPGPGEVATGGVGRDPVNRGSSAPVGAGDTAAPTCVLAMDGLEIGGIGSVVEVLAGGLPRHGMSPVVVCTDDGVRAARLRASGVPVHRVVTEHEALELFRTADVVACHSAPAFMERAALHSGLPVVPVMHNTEIHYTRARWRDFTALLAGSALGIAVSRTVGEMHVRRTGTTTPVRVVPNAAPPGQADPDTRSAARALLSRMIGEELGDDVVFVCLARYDSQKNIAGLVAALSALPPEAGVRLVCAGDAADRVEHRRADALRRASRVADRIHLLGHSSAATLLDAADAFVLDSFFEGWPMAASEAAARGLPLVLADVGGAVELVERDPGRSVLVPNATGAAEAVTDRRVRAAKARTRHQPNAAALRQAVLDVARRARVRSGSAPTTRQDTGVDDVERMLAGHADALRDAADRVVSGCRPD